jgi:hypothetical protein
VLENAIIHFLSDNRCSDVVFVPSACCESRRDPAQPEAGFQVGMPSLGKSHCVKTR